MQSPPCNTQIDLYVRWSLIYCWVFKVVTGLYKRANKKVLGEKPTLLHCSYVWGHIWYSSSTSSITHSRFHSASVRTITSPLYLPHEVNQTFIPDGSKPLILWHCPALFASVDSSLLSPDVEARRDNSLNLLSSWIISPAPIVQKQPYLLIIIRLVIPEFSRYFICQHLEYPWLPSSGHSFKFSNSITNRC